MKSKIKRPESTQLPRFVVGALATAGASAASGATVQITFANNVLSSLTGTTLFNPDLTGDGGAELYGSIAIMRRYNVAAVAIYTVISANNYRIFANAARNLGDPRYQSRMSVTVGQGGFIGFPYPYHTELSTRGMIHFTFSDARINSGNSTAGWLDLEASTSAGDSSVRVHRLVFDDSSTTAPDGVFHTDGAYPEWQVSPVPEPGSNLALLALGAGGLTMRRRLKRAA